MGTRCFPEPTELCSLQFLLGSILHQLNMGNFLVLGQEILLQFIICAIFDISYDLSFETEKLRFKKKLTHSKIGLLSFGVGTYKCPYSFMSPPQ